MSDSEPARRQTAGRKIMAGFRGTGLNRELKYLIDTICVGGIILFARNIENRRQVTNLCTGAREYAASRGRPGLLIAVDQEGGQVARLRSPEFFEPPPAAEIKNPEQAAQAAGKTAKQLARLGINVNMAPVMDVADPEGPATMAGRSFSGDPQKVAEIGSAAIKGLEGHGVTAVAKHFPGIGRAASDTHKELPDVNVCRQDLESEELVPFHAAVKAGAGGIMLSHVRYPALDPVWPASLSRKITGGLLRGRLNYPGLVITDDLDMGAIADNYDIKTAASRILAAGIDMALICHSMEKIESAFETFLSAY